MSTVTFERFSTAFPPERELLTIGDDGRFTMWRSFGATAAGRFAGTVPEPTKVADLARATRRAKPPTVSELESDASIEYVAVDKRKAEAGSRVPGPWGELLVHCRQLLRELVDQPRAAITAAIDPAGSVSLSHAGTEVLPIELANLEVRIVRWNEGREAASDRVRPGIHGHVDAAPGWSLDVPFDTTVLGAGQVVATVTFVVVDAGVYVPVALTARWGQP